MSYEPDDAGNDIVTTYEKVTTHNASGIYKEEFVPKSKVIIGDYDETSEK